MPNQMSDSRDGGPTFFMRQFGLFHTYRTVLQPGLQFDEKPVEGSKHQLRLCCLFGNNVWFLVKKCWIMPSEFCGKGRI